MPGSLNSYIPQLQCLSERTVSGSLFLRLPLVVSLYTVMIASFDFYHWAGCYPSCYVVLHKLGVTFLAGSSLHTDRCLPTSNSGTAHP